MRVGIGHRQAAFEPGKPLFLGGLKLEGAWGLREPGDGDVLLLALADAILGAAGATGVGSDVPAPSAVVLAESRVRARARGYVIGNVDLSLLLPRPDLEPHLDLMRARIAELLAIDRAQVGIKVGSPGGLGGASEGGMEAWAVALLLEAAAEAAAAEEPA